MSPLEIRRYTPSDRDAVVRLWEDCQLVVPWNDPVKDIARKIAVQPEGLLVAIRDGEVVGAVMVGYEGHRGWINYLAVAPAHRRMGIGTRLMQEAEGWLRALGCPKINLQVRTSNQGVIAFYRTLGFSVDDVIGMGKRLESDTV